MCEGREGGRLKPTASKTALLSACQYWARPDVECVETTSEAAERGTRFHEAIARYVNYDFYMIEHVDEDIAPEYHAAVAWLYGRSMLDAEVAYGWDPKTDTAKVLGGNRNYAKGNGLFCGTADLVGYDERSKCLRVYDWKTGDGSHAGPQLRSLALLAARAFQAEGREVESVYVSALEVRADGVTERCAEELDAFALSVHAGELAEVLERVPNAEPNPGSHCKDLYCPARAACPVSREGVAQAIALIPEGGLVRAKDWRITDPIETPEQAALALDVLRLAEEVIELKKKEIKALVPAEGWVCEDGRVLKETKSSVQAFDKNKAIDLLKTFGATDEQINRTCFYTYERSNGLRISGGTTPKRNYKKTEKRTGTTP